MPIVPGKPGRKLVAALLLPSWLQLQSSPTGSLESMKDMLKDLEKMAK